MDRRERLKVLQAARQFSERVQEMIRHLPRRAAPGLRLQFAEAARSIGANIAEGFGRGTKPEELHFLRMANGSLEESQGYLKECINGCLIRRDAFFREWNLSIAISKMLARLIEQREAEE
jgi:four helix bundle protein